LTADIKIIIADDHAVVRKGLIQILTDVQWISEVDEAANGFELLDKIDEYSYDMVILDISMPGLNGLEVIKEIRKKKPSLPMLVLSIHPEEQYAVRVLKAGASGYITKESAPEELLTAIETIIGERKYITPSVAQQLASNVIPDNRLPHERLSDREFQVFKLIAEGNSLKEIALILNLSEKTISTYKVRIFDKMGMKTRSEIVKYAIEKNLMG